MEDPPLDGLGADIPTIKRLCRDDPEAVNEIDKVEQEGSRPGGRTDLVDIIHKVVPSERPSGTSA